MQTKLDLVSDGYRLSAGLHHAASPRGIVLFLHGIPSTSPPDPDDRGYPGLCQDFAAQGWSAAWADMRGKQDSEGFFSIEGWVRDASELVQAAKVGAYRDLPVAVVGSSAGGAVAAEVVRRGAAVDALALLAAPAAWQSYAADPVAGARRVMSETGMRLDPQVEADPTAWAEEFEHVTTVDSIAGVRVPVLIIHGTADDVVPVDHAYAIAARAPDARVEILEGAQHQLRRDLAALDILSRWLEETL